MKHLLAISLLSALFGCVGGDGGTDTSVNPVIFAHGNETIRLDKPTEYAVEIPSAGNAITVATGNTVTHVVITGANNSLIVEHSVLIRAMEITGANNSVALGTTVTVPSFEINGANATVSIAAGNRIDRLIVSGSNDIVTIRDASAAVPVINLSGTNISLRVPIGYRSHTTITNTGTNNVVIEQ